LAAAIALSAVLESGIGVRIEPFQPAQRLPVGKRGDLARPAVAAAFFASSAALAASAASRAKPFRPAPAPPPGDFGGD